MGEGETLCLCLFRGSSNSSCWVGPRYHTHLENYSPASGVRQETHVGPEFCSDTEKRMATLLEGQEAHWNKSLPRTQDRGLATIGRRDRHPDRVPVEAEVHQACLTLQLMWRTKTPPAPQPLLLPDWDRDTSTERGPLCQRS